MQQFAFDWKCKSDGAEQFVWIAELQIPSHHGYGLLVDLFGYIREKPANVARGHDFVGNVLDWLDGEEIGGKVFYYDLETAKREMEMRMRKVANAQFAEYMAVG